MELTQAPLGKLFRKYLFSSLGSAVIISIYAFVDAIAVGQAEGPDGSAAMAVLNPLFGVLVFLALVVAFALIVALTNRQGPVSSGTVMIGEWVSILAVVAGILVNRSKSKKAYSDPALMEKRYRSVLNSHMEATLMPVIGGVRHVDIPKRA